MTAATKPQGWSFTWADLHTAYGDLCEFCSSPAVAVVPRTPWARGGGRDLTNAAPACESCRKAKGRTRTVEEWQVASAADPLDLVPEDARHQLAEGQLRVQTRLAEFRARAEAAQADRAVRRSAWKRAFDEGRQNEGYGWGASGVTCR